MSDLNGWRYDGEASRDGLHRIGADIELSRLALAELRMQAQFPTFAHPTDVAIPTTTRDQVTKRRDLVAMTHQLPPSNLEILDWLARGNDKEAAFLYAYSRASVSESSPIAKAEFFDKVEAMVREDSALGDIRDAESLWRLADTRYSECLALGSENLQQRITRGG